MKKKTKFAFLILHYMTSEDTIKCIDSIEKMCDRKDYTIIVVDNGSKNESGLELKDKYRYDTNVTIIVNKENLGFAKGNNVGFKYIKDNYDVQFIIMCNNDTCIIQKDFLERVEKEYRKSQFDVLGPKIRLRDNTYFIFDKKIPTAKEARKKIIKLTTRYYLKNTFIYKIHRKIKNLHNNEKNDNEEKINNRRECVVLHGSFLVFSKAYINKFDGINEKTFLYVEEELLALRLRQNNMKSVYCPEICVFHNEDSATNAILHTTKEKEKFKYKNEKKSLKILYSELKKDNSKDNILWK